MIIANWKSNIIDVNNWYTNFNNFYKPMSDSAIIGVAPPTIYLDKLLTNIGKGDSEIKVGVQDVDHLYGSRTGTISVDMIIETGCRFAIIGHSERREIFNEDNDLIKEKLKSLNKRAMVVLCVGETKEENEKGLTKDILENQLEIVNKLELDKEFIVAYEPVWAIGSGLTPEPKDINEIHKYIKDVVQSNSANNLLPKILYGGSVTDKNAESFFKEKFVDGALIGRASLDGTTFAKIVNIFNTIKKL
tara:strand:- start:360 stop:1100 length:741 start_codon:yes stop_codon:yes gene_type:complete